jgi:hypothetical protein
MHRPVAVEVSYVDGVLAGNPRDRISAALAERQEQSLTAEDIFRRALKFRRVLQAARDYT